MRQRETMRRRKRRRNHCAALASNDNMLVIINNNNNTALPYGSPHCKLRPTCGRCVGSVRRNKHANDKTQPNAQRTADDLRPPCAL
jgi:hypothetical protein